MSETSNDDEFAEAVEALNSTSAKRIEQLERELAEARDEATHWKKQCQQGFNIAELIQQRDQLERKLTEARRAIEGMGSVLTKSSAIYDVVTEQRDRLAEALREIRIIQGDFEEPWSERETRVNNIAAEALAAAKGGES